jgi:hypothetical protein
MKKAGHGRKIVKSLEKMSLRQLRFTVDLRNNHLMGYLNTINLIRKMKESTYGV